MKKEFYEYDIVIVGGGPGGLPAALEAARHGAKVLLVEKNGYLGGNLTIGLPLLGYLDKDGNPIIRGIAQELVDALAQRGAAGPHTWCPLHNSVTIYDHEVFKVVAFEKCLEAGVDLLLHTEIIDTNVEDGRLASITLFGKSRCTEVRAKVFVDATGDGDVAYLAGAASDVDVYVGRRGCGKDHCISGGASRAVRVSGEYAHLSGLQCCAFPEKSSKPCICWDAEAISGTEGRGQAAGGP